MPRPSIPCNVCGAFDAEQIRSKDRDGRPLFSVICRRCGLVWTDPRPEPDDVRDFYATRYRIEYKGTYAPSRRHLYRSTKTARERLQRLAGTLRPGARVFDIGAGSGEVVHLLRTMGCEARGIEPNQGYARYASETRGLPIECGFYQDARIQPASLDVVTMYHAAEHFENPFEAIAKAAEWLVPGGVLVVEVPNVEAVCQQPHQQFHRGHLYHFNLFTLSALFRRAGFEVVETYTSPDGGNIAVTGRRLRGTSDVTAAACENPGNYTRVAAILRGHTALRHAFSIHPWVRPIRKLAARLDEWRHM